jgi:hypothetical protein
MIVAMQHDAFERRTSLKTVLFQPLPGQVIAFVDQQPCRLEIKGMGLLRTLGRDHENFCLFLVCLQVLQ